ncbi:MAG: phospholipase D-like domain-containing protein [Bacteroidota bacterium]
MKKIILVSLFAFVCIIQKSTAQISINDAHLAAIGTTVTIKGVAINGAELGSIRYIQDNTGGIAAFGSTTSSVNRGDSVQVTGVLSNYNNLLEITPITSINVISSGHTLPSIQLLSPATFNETYESELIQVNRVIFATPGVVFAANTNYNFTSSGQSGQIRITSGSNLVGKTIPSVEVTLKGILSQFCTAPASGCTSGYQVLPRDTNDITVLPGIHITSPIDQININTTSFDLAWTTDLLGTSIVKYGYTPNLELGLFTGASSTTNHNVSCTGLMPASIYYAQVYSVNGTDTSFSAIKAYATKSLSSGTIKVYFNNPVNNSVSTGTNAIYLPTGIDDTLINYINRAKYTLDMTIYDFDNNGISNISTAINNAANRGVRVRFISDGNNVATNLGVNDLNTTIPKLLSPVGGPYNIMHNKFVIIDAKSTNPMDPIVWTGAINWTNRQINEDPNDAIILQDQSLAKAYTLEFEEMWGDTGSIPNTTISKFGPDKTDNTPHHFIINNKEVESYFSPSDGVNSKILSLINESNYEIDFATMIITRTDLANALAAKAGSPVNVFGIVNDNVATTQWATLLTAMTAARLQDYTDTSIMHHKYMIIDHDNLSSDPTLLTGSHNWSTSAETRNDENTIIVHDPTIANIYYQAFYDLFTSNGGVGLFLNENDFEKQTISIYPIPSINELNINSSVNLNQLKIFNTQGKLIEEIKLNETKNTKLNVSEYRSGLYVLQLFSNGKFSTVKFIKE